VAVLPRNSARLSMPSMRGLLAQILRYLPPRPATDQCKSRRLEWNSGHGLLPFPIEHLLVLQLVLCLLATCGTPGKAVNWRGEWPFDSNRCEGATRMGLKWGAVLKSKLCGGEGVRQTIIFHRLLPLLFTMFS
jgi:hypothetical protein